MYTFKRLKEAHAKLTEGATSPVDYQERSDTFVRELHEALGVRYARGGGEPFYRDQNGMPYRKPNAVSPREYSLREMGQAILGSERFEDFFGPSSDVNFSRLREAAIDPSSFVDINTYTASVAGLINAQIMDAFQNPAYIGRQLISTEQSRMNGYKRIGIGRLTPLSKSAKDRRPAERHIEVGLTEMFQVTPETREQALKMILTREASYFDLTGELLGMAAEVGDELARQQEQDIADEVLGVTNSYNFGGTSYNSYQTSSPWINDQSNPFADYKDLDDVRQLFIGMTDPITGREIDIRGYTILVMPGREMLMRQMLFGSQVSAGTQLNSNFPSVTTVGPNPAANLMGRGIDIIPLTAFWYNRATAADGLNLSAANAVQYWYVGDFKRAFTWIENWGTTLWQASPDELEMKDRGLVQVYGANYRGVMFTKEPRYVVRNKN